MFAKSTVHRQVFLKPGGITMNLRLYLLNLLAIIALVVITVGVGTLTVGAQDATATPMAEPASDAAQPNTVTGNVLVTETRPFSQELMNQLTLPEGFEISVFADGLENARMMAVSDAGVIYVSRPAQQDVIALFDQNADGMVDMEGFRVVAENIPQAHGLAIRDNRLYIGSEKQILVADILEDGNLSATEVVSDNLPDGDQHGRRTLEFGPDGMLYVGLGSSCNACIESNPENAAVVRVPLDGSERTLFAEGLRNTLGFSWHPVTGEMWGWDHGSDMRGDDQPPEELNLLTEGSNYGWPFCYGSQQVDKFIPYKTDNIKGMTNEEFCATTTEPVWEYQAHSAPIDFLFYTANQFGGDYMNDAFVTMRGSWNRFPATGYKVVHINFDENGQPVEITDFVSGFLIEEGVAHFARVAGLAVAPDGSLLISDDTNGVIYRVAYTGS
jgi:glucose/arabinose dehydrogenase